MSYFLFKSSIAGAIGLAITLSVSTSTLFASNKEEVIETYGDKLNKNRIANKIRLSENEGEISKIANQAAKVSSKVDQAGNRKIYGNEFNPSIGIILNGKYSAYSQSDSEIKGFGIGHEGERGSEGLAVDHSELNFSASIDDKFTGSLTAAIASHGSSDHVELEEAYIKTSPGFNLPVGLSIKAGRAFWTLGYLNEHHAHTEEDAHHEEDDHHEEDNHTEEGASAYSLFARLGGDIGMNQTWRIGGYWLRSNVRGRESNEHNISFYGRSDLYAVDFRYTWAPTGNQRNKELILQGEVFFRSEQGTYNDEGGNAYDVAFDDSASGWYAQSVYKFQQQWRVGYRYTALRSPGTPTGLIGTDLDSEGHNPYIHSIMADWTNSEFSRIRLQYNNDKTAKGQTDNQLILQYTMSIGAHGAHKY